MIKTTSSPEIYVLTGFANTWDHVLPTASLFCTKHEILNPGLGTADYQSNLSAAPDCYADRIKSSVKISGNNTFHSVRDSIEDTISDHLSARDMLYHWEKQDRGRLASAYAVYFIEKNFSLMNLDVINSLLLAAAPRRLTPWSMIALLRASYSAKHLLPAWHLFYTLVKNELKDNERAPSLLAGLDQ